MRPVLALGLLLAAAGCLSIYLGAAHQRLAARRWPPRPARIAGALLLAVALATLLQDLRPVAACFVFGTWAMLVFVLLPYLGALRALREAQE